MEATTIERSNLNFGINDGNMADPQNDGSHGGNQSFDGYSCLEMIPK